MNLYFKLHLLLIGHQSVQFQKITYLRPKEVFTVELA